VHKNLTLKRAHVYRSLTINSNAYAPANAQTAKIVNRPRLYAAVLNNGNSGNMKMLLLIIIKIKQGKLNKSAPIAVEK